MPTDLSRMMRVLRRYERATERVTNDLYAPKNIYLSFDHSLLYPWLSRPKNPTNYDRDGMRLFDLYRKYGSLTPYRLLLSASTYFEILDQLHHRTVFMEHLASGSVHIRQLYKNLSAKEAKEAFQSVYSRMSLNSIDYSHFSALLEMLSGDLMKGTKDVFPEFKRDFLRNENIFKRHRESLLNHKEYDQKDKADRAFHIDMDVLQTLEVVHIHQIYQESNDQVSYTGEYPVRASFEHLKNTYSRDPLCILIACYAFSQSTGKVLSLAHASNYLKNFSNAMKDAQKMLEVYRKREYCLRDLSPDDEKLLRGWQKHYITPIYMEEEDNKNTDAQPQATVTIFHRNSKAAQSDQVKIKQKRLKHLHRTGGLNEALCTDDVEPSTNAQE